MQRGSPGGPTSLLTGYRQGAQTAGELLQALSSPTVFLMFTRIWRTEFDTARQDELQRFAEDISAPMFHQLPGCVGYLHAVTGSTWITQTFWESEQHIKDAEASAVYREVVSAILATGFLGDQQSTEVFEVTGYAAPPG